MLHCKLKSSLFSLMLLILLGLTVLLNQKIKTPHVTPNPSAHSLTLSANLYKIFSLGNHRLASSLLWIHTLIASDIEHYKGKALQSWMFMRFIIISRLDPYFKELYLYGGQYLSVIKDDIPGASTLFNKGLYHYPEDLEMNYFAGMHFYLEEQDYQKAFKLFNKIKLHPRAPRNLISIVARMQANLNKDLKLALELLEISLQKTPKNTPLYKKINNNIINLKIQIDIECLNKRKSNCSLTDPYGKEYPKKNGIYIAPKDWKPFEMVKQRPTQ